MTLVIKLMRDLMYAFAITHTQGKFANLIFVPNLTKIAQNGCDDIRFEGIAFVSLS